MNLEIPKNIFAAIFALSLPDSKKPNITVNSSSLISQNLEQDKIDLGLIPSFDLVKHKELFVSRNVAVSFDGILSNAYFYFIPGQEDFKEIFLNGDVSSNEIILSKILFKERYNKDVKITLDSQPFKPNQKNYCLIGNENFESENFRQGVSFADQTVALIDYPYVNFVLASKSQEKLQQFTDYTKEWDKKIEDSIGEILSEIDFSEEVNAFIRNNLNTVYYEMTKNEEEGLNELLRLPYFHGIIGDIIEVKYV